MTDFKLKIVLGGAAIELEGEGQLVKEILEDLKETGLGNLAKTVPVSKQEPKAQECDINNISTDEEENTEQSETEFPNIKDLIISGNLHNDQEKILIFAYYLSNYGQDAVSEDEIRNKFKEMNLWTNSACGNFKTNIKKLIGDKKYLSSYGNTSYTVTMHGQEQAKAIILGQGQSSKKTKSKNNKTTKNPITKYEFIDLNLSTEDKKNLVDLFINKENLKATEKVTLASYWYKKQKNEKVINKDSIYSILKNANISTSFNIQGALINAKTRNNYFYPSNNNGEYEISHIGEEYVENNLLIQG